MAFILTVTVVQAKTMMNHDHFSLLFFKIMKMFSSVLCFCFPQQKQQSVNIDNTIGSLSYDDDCGNDSVKKQ